MRSRLRNRLNQLLVGGLFIPSGALLWGRMFQEGTGQTVVNHGSGGDFWRGADGNAASDDPAWGSPAGLVFDGGDHCAIKSGTINLPGDLLFISLHTCPAIPTNKVLVSQAGAVGFEYRSTGDAWRLDGAALWTHGHTYVSGDNVVGGCRRVGTDIFFFSGAGPSTVWSSAVAHNSNAWPMTVIGMLGDATRHYDGTMYDLVLIPGTFTQAQAQVQIDGIQANVEELFSITMLAKP